MADQPKKPSKLILVIPIILVALGGILGIPSVRHALFSGQAATPVAVTSTAQAGSAAVPPAKKVIVENPRNASPMGQNTVFFSRGKQWPFEIEEKNATRVQYYYLWTPPAADATKKYPLVVFLHDEDGMAAGAASLIASKQMQTALPAFIVVPQIPKDKTWAFPDKFSGQEFGTNKKEQSTALAAKYPPEKQSLHDVMVLAAQLISRYNIDMDRVYIVGCGEGGTGVYGAAARYPDFFAGAVAISGLWSFNDAAKMAKLPLLVMHGTQDKTTDVMAGQGMAQLIRRAGSHAIYYQEIPDLAHKCDDPRLYAPAMWQWLLSLRKAPDPVDMQVGGYQDMQAPAHP